MAKKKNSADQSKGLAKAAKKAKAVAKVEKKEKKKSKGRAVEEDGEDLEDILEQMRREWEESHAVSEELVAGPPSRRANATFTACPSGNYLWCIGGEFFSEDGKAYFYQDVFRYNPEKDEWRKFVSKNAPGPRSAHAVVASPIGGGKLFLFGGEFSSQNQSSFHHYRDFWCFDTGSHSWDRIETKIKPTARSGHRMAAWKQYIVLFGGFYDPGIVTRYLNDLWVFDTQEYKWTLIEYKASDQRPSPRSGFSFLPTVDGIVLHGGYCKEYAKGKRPIGVMLEDTWFLKLSLETESTSKKSSGLIAKWERRKRKSTAYAPSIRSGCTMTLWSAKEMGILFGGVTDEDKDEETLESVFHNDLYGYQLAGGRWVSLILRTPKKKAGGKKKGLAVSVAAQKNKDEDEGFSDDAHDRCPLPKIDTRDAGDANAAFGPDDPDSSRPLPRYNPMLAVLRNTLFIYGGIFEQGSREYTLDDFYYLSLDKMERYVCLRESGVVIAEDTQSSSDEDGDEDDEDEDTEGENDYDMDDTEMVVEEVGVEKEQKEIEEWEPEDEFREPVMELKDIVEGPSAVGDESQVNLREQAAAFMGISKDSTRTTEDVLSTPLPGETLAMFYARSSEYWTQKARDMSDHRGKELRRDAFLLAEERYNVYKTILQEVEKILAEAGLDEQEMKAGAAHAAAGGVSGQSRNRR